MKKATWILMGMALAPVAASPAGADNALLIGARLETDDVPALAGFYEAAFDMQPVERHDMPNGMKEIFLKSGDTIDPANGKRIALLLMITNIFIDSSRHYVGHLVFSVSDVAATTRALTAAGGKSVPGPTGFANSKSPIVIGTDPAGNRIDVIYREPGSGAIQLKTCPPWRSLPQDLRPYRA
jgi:predicted enzyme related to lactoylglutathione lyase